jgi:hypothetical protein
MEHRVVGCIARAPGDDSDSAELMDLSCMNSRSGSKCRSGLPFYRRALQAGENFNDCFTFCLSRGLDLFGIAPTDFDTEDRDLEPAECRCGATPANTGIWESAPREELLLPRFIYAEDDPKCVIPVWQYVGGLEDGVVPSILLESSQDDTAYIDSIVAGRDVSNEEEGEDDERK